MELQAMTTKSNRIYSLDILRILATLCILIYHFEQVFDFWGASIIDFTVLMNGSLIVEFFFVLSGFLAASDAKRLHEGTYSFTSYVTKKFVRLVPVIIFPCILYTVICYIMRTFTGNGGWYFDTAVDIPATISAMFGVQFWGFIDGNFINYPLWYVDVLLLCYIVMAVIAKFASKLKLRPVYFFVPIIFTGMILWNTSSAVPFFNQFIARGYYAFFWGVILGMIYEKSDRVNLDKAWAFVLFLVISVGSILLVVNKPDWFMENGRYVLTFISYSSLLLAFLNPIPQKIFNFKGIGMAGKVTYDIYAWHLVVYLLAAFLIKAGVLDSSLYSYGGMFALVAVSALVGAASYVSIDKLALWLLRKIKALFK